MELSDVFKTNFYMLWPFVVFYGNLVSFVVNHCIFPILVYLVKIKLATLPRTSQQVPETGVGAPLPNHSLATALCRYFLRMGVQAIRSPRCSGAWVRCYDFKNIFAKKFGKKWCSLTQNKAKFCKILIITPIFSPKIAKNRRKL
jgi:hypothetical protein